MPSTTKKDLKFDLIWAQYGQKIERLCFSLLGRELGQDARQEVALALPDALQKFRGDAGLGTYIFAVTRTICMRQLQKKSRWDNKHDPGALELLVQDDEDPDLRLLKRGLGHIEEKLRAPLLLVLIEGYSVAEVSEMLELPEGTIKTRIRAAKEKLARWMNVEGTRHEKI